MVLFKLVYTNVSNTIQHESAVLTFFYDFLQFFHDFLSLFLAYPSKPITPYNPYPGPFTKRYGLWGVRLYHQSTWKFCAA